MSNTAKPCPFCGARFRTVHDVSARTQQLICMSCGARGPEVDRSQFAVEAEKAWDRRMPDGVQADNTCPRCRKPAANLFRTTLPGDELDTTHCGCLYADGVPERVKGDVNG